MGTNRNAFGPAIRCSDVLVENTPSNKPFAAAEAHGVRRTGGALIKEGRMNYVCSRLEAADECASDQGKGTRVRVVLEKIKVLDYHGPLVHGSGEVSLMACAQSENFGGSGGSTRLPVSGAYPVLNQFGGYVVDINKEIFRGMVEDDLKIEIWSAETEEKKRTSYYRRALKGQAAKWLREYKPATRRATRKTWGTGRFGIELRSCN
jgi:hypothetical protein